MNDIVSPDEESIAPEHPLQLAVSPIRILLYSDDVNTREKVRLAVGPRSAGRPIEWVETATHEGTVMQADTESFDLMILDGEAANRAEWVSRGSSSTSSSRARR
jgi:hypothetical protein